MWMEVPEPTKIGRWLRIYLFPQEWLNEVGARLDDKAGLITITTDEDVFQWYAAYKNPETLVYTCTETTIVGYLLYKYLLLKWRCKEWLVKTRYTTAKKNSRIIRLKNYKRNLRKESKRRS